MEKKNFYIIQKQNNLEKKKQKLTENQKNLMCLQNYNIKFQKNCERRSVYLKCVT